MKYIIATVELKVVNRREIEFITFTGDRGSVTFKASTELKPEARSLITNTSTGGKEALILKLSPHNPTTLRLPQLNLIVKDTVSELYINKGKQFKHGLQPLEYLEVLQNL